MLMLSYYINNLYGDDTIYLSIIIYFYHSNNLLSNFKPINSHLIYLMSPKKNY